ncbi:MAG: hypothetical protein ABI353_21205 [Isosphaeraceae bacterium]
MWSRLPRRRDGRAVSRRACGARLEVLEDRRLLTVARPDIVMTAASTADSRGVTVVYDLNGADLDRPFEVGLYRSADDRFDPSDRLIAAETVAAPAPTGIPTDLDGAPAGALGTHRLTIEVPGGLTPDPSRPFVLAVADPANVIPEANEANNTAGFRKYTLAVIAHGGIQGSKTDPPAWELRMGQALRRVGYDRVIPYNWAAESAHPGAAAKQGPRVANLVLKTAAKFPEGAPVDLHLIGHSEGAVVVSQALLALHSRWTPELRAGFTKVTLLDPHAANNQAPGGQLSVSSGFRGWIAKQVVHSYQSKAKDPLVVVPSDVDQTEVYYQHTPVSLDGANDGVYNLWGQVPIRGQATYCDLTGPGTSHTGPTGIHEWYTANVVPTLRDGVPCGCPTELDGQRIASAGDQATPKGVTISPNRQPAFHGKAAPGAGVRLFAGRSGDQASAPVGRTTADPDGSWSITSRPLAPGRYRFLVRGIVPSGPPRSRSHLFPTLRLDSLIIPVDGTHK